MEMLPLEGGGGVAGTAGMHLAKTLVLVL